MRILTVGGMYPPHYLGGYELVWQAFVQRARQRGHEVAILTSDLRFDGASGPDDPSAQRVIEWHVRGNQPRLRRRDVLRRELRAAAAFDRAAEPRPDLVVWFHMLGIPLGLLERARRRRIPSLAVVHDEWPLYGIRQDAWLGPWASRPGAAARAAAALARLPTRVDVVAGGDWSFNSAWLRDRVLAQAPAPGAGRITVISPGIQPERFPPGPERDWEGRLAYVGRVEPRKGVAQAVDALAQLPDAHLTVTGYGDEAYLAELRARAREHGAADRLTLAPAVPNEELARVYAAADAVLFPVTWDEPWGLVPLEAMAVGRPVVATGTGGSAEYLRDGENALLVPPGDAGALAAAVRRLASDGELRRRLRRGGLATAAGHDNADFLDALEREALRTGGAGRTASP